MFNVFTYKLANQSVNGSNPVSYTHLEKIRKRKVKCEIIFLTALEGYSREGYKVNACRYILKDENMYSELQEGLKESTKRLHNKRIKINTNQGILYLDKSDISYVEVLSLIHI